MALGRGIGITIMATTTAQIGVHGVITTMVGITVMAMVVLA
jgi:hypothetical protein